MNQHACNHPVYPCPQRFMRSPPIACRRAVHSIKPASSQHIWISDDHLSRALSHFFRAVCPHQKRYGSHVPGPLEAQRRAAKRKMTAQASYQDYEPYASPLSIFGAWFAAVRRRRGEPKWRYEPPSLLHHPPAARMCTFLYVQTRAIQLISFSSRCFLYYSDVGDSYA